MKQHWAKSWMPFLGVSLLLAGALSVYFLFVLPRVKGLGDSFGFFSAVALVIVSVALLYQIRAFKENIRQVREEVRRSIVSRRYEALLAEHQRYFDLYLRYRVVFEEILAGKTHNIPLSKLVEMLRDMFARLFIKLKNTELAHVDFDISTLPRKTTPDESDRSLGARVLNWIADELERFHVQLHETYEQALSADAETNGHAAPK